MGGSRTKVCLVCMCTALVVVNIWLYIQRDSAKRLLLNTARPLKGTTRPVGYTARPLKGTSPEANTARTLGDTASSLGDTVSPRGNTARPLEGIAKPEGDITRPQGDNCCPLGDTANPEGKTARPLEDTASPEESTVIPMWSTDRLKGKSVRTQRDTGGQDSNTARPMKSTADPFWDNVRTLEDQTKGPYEEATRPDSTYTAIPLEDTSKPLEDSVSLLWHTGSPFNNSRPLQYAGRHPGDTWKSNQLKRKETLKRYCARNHSSDLDKVVADIYAQKPHPYTGAYVVDDKYKVIFCAITKVASSTLKLLLANRTGQVPTPKTNDDLKEAIHLTRYLNKFNINTLGQNSMHAIKMKIHNYMKFIIVRHPLVRLFSAYNDKVAFEDRSPTYSRLRQLIRKYIYYHAPPIKPRARRFGGSPNITWSEFITWYLAHDHHDAHLVSYTKRCEPCVLQYDLIGHYETLQEDLPRILHALYGDSSQDVLDTLYVNVSPRRGHEALLKAMKELTLTQIEALDRILGPDMDMFGYSPFIQYYTNDLT